MISTAIDEVRPKPRKASKPGKRRLEWRWETHPWLGLLSAITGSSAAFLLVPSDFQEAGRLCLPALLMTLGLMAVPLRVLFTSPASVFHPLPLIAASPAYWLLLDLIQGSFGLEGVSQEDVRLAFLMIGLFSVSVWVTGLARPWNLPQVVKQAATVSLNTSVLFRIGIAAFLLAFLRFAIPSGFDFAAMLAAFGENRWGAPWARGALGGWDAFLDHIGYFGYMLPPVTAILARRVGIFNWRTLLMALASFVILALFSTGGGRRIVGVMVGSGLVVWFLSARPPKLRDLVTLGALMAGLLAFMQVMLLYRGVGIAAAFSEETQIKQESSHLRIDDNFLRLAQTIHIIPYSHPHVGADYLIWVIARPIPRVFWPEKPLDPGFDLPQFLGQSGVSLTVSLVGELYMAFGFLGCIGGGLFVGYLANTLPEVFKTGATPGALIIFGGGLLALFAGMRSGIEMILMSYGILAWIVVVWVYRKFQV